MWIKAVAAQPCAPAAFLGVQRAIRMSRLLMTLKRIAAFTVIGLISMPS
jgi:hypothetical protein